MAVVFPEKLWIMSDCISLCSIGDYKMGPHGPAAAQMNGAER